MACEPLVAYPGDGARLPSVSLLRGHARSTRHVSRACPLLFWSCVARHSRVVTRASGAGKCALAPPSPSTRMQPPERLPSSRSRQARTIMRIRNSRSVCPARRLVAGRASNSIRFLVVLPLRTESGARGAGGPCWVGVSGPRRAHLRLTQGSQRRHSAPAWKMSQRCHTSQQHVAVTRAVWYTRC